jgi:hypothetical protein
MRGRHRRDLEHQFRRVRKPNPDPTRIGYDSLDVTCPKLMITGSQNTIKFDDYWNFSHTNKDIKDNNDGCEPSDVQTKIDKMAPHLHNTTAHCFRAAGEIPTPCCHQQTQCSQVWRNAQCTRGGDARHTSRDASFVRQRRNLQTGRNAPTAREGKQNTSCAKESKAHPWRHVRSGRRRMVAHSRQCSWGAWLSRSSCFIGFIPSGTPCQTKPNQSD